MPSGIHHVTAITAGVQANVDFYAGFLGLRLVKQTAGFADGEQLHLFYGDAAGSPGSLISFLVWEAGARGRMGHGQVFDIALAVPAASIGDWLARALGAQIPVEGPRRAFGEPVLRLRDPDGLIVKLVGVDLPATAPLPDPSAPLRLRAVTLLTETPAATGAFLARFGYRAGPLQDGVQRMLSDSDAIDLRDGRGFVPAIPGTGMIDHLALRAPDAQALRAMRLAPGMAQGLTEVHDRRYFLSLYLREPGGHLIEYATDGPGFGLDETPQDLGRTLFIPPHDAARAQDLRVMLPQFALPGQERMPQRDLPFVHRFYRPDDPDGSVMVLLHGSGGSEADLMPLAHRIAPRATLLGLRGRATEEGRTRWFRRFDAARFDQADLRHEAAAFNGFMQAAVRRYGLTAERISYLGYSNGANLLGAAMLLHPGLVRRAILLRALAVLEDAPQPDLSGADILLLSGRDDPFVPLAPGLEPALRHAGARVTAQVLPGDHALGAPDLEAARNWWSAPLPA